ncbi:MAG: hypothetical protein WA131_05020 [Desulfitobacteriaceae bacterium]
MTPVLLEPVILRDLFPWVLRMMLFCATSNILPIVPVLVQDEIVWLTEETSGNNSESQVF